MPHQVFVGIPKDVIAIRPVFGEVERLVFENGDEIAEPVDHLLAGAKLGGIVEIRHIGEFVGAGQRSNDALVDLVADVRFALERNHVPETGPWRDRDRRVGCARVFVADVFDEQQNQHVILVLAGIHPAAQFIAPGPKGGVEF